MDVGVDSVLMDLIGPAHAGQPPLYGPTSYILIEHEERCKQHVVRELVALAGEAYAQSVDE